MLIWGARGGGGTALSLQLQAIDSLAVLQDFEDKSEPGEEFFEKDPKYLVME